MENPDKRLSPEKDLIHFKAVVRSVMIDASKVIANIELLCQEMSLRSKLTC
jgi:hypothetical protein